MFLTLALCNLLNTSYPPLFLKRGSLLGHLVLLFTSGANPVLNAKVVDLLTVKSCDEKLV
jgi:hypothetical protein